MAANRDLGNGLFRYWGNLSFPDDTGEDLVESKAGVGRLITDNSWVTSSGEGTVILKDGSTELDRIHFPGPGAFQITLSDKIQSSSSAAITAECSDSIELNFRVDVQDINQ